MSAWVESTQEDTDQEDPNNVEKAFEDDFVAKEDFQKLDDSDDYLKILGNFTTIPYRNVI